MSNHRTETIDRLIIEAQVHRAVDKLIDLQFKGGDYWDMATLEEFVEKICKYYDPEFTL